MRKILFFPEMIHKNTRPTPIINLAYEKPTCPELSLPDRQKSHMPKTQGAGRLIRSYISNLNEAYTNCYGVC